MQNPVRVEVVPTALPADDKAVANALRELETARGSGSVTEIDVTEIERLQNRYSAAQRLRTGWMARIAGAEFRVEAFGVEPAADGGRAMVSLLVAADSVSIGDPSRGGDTPAVRSAVPERRGWGAPGPDPRAGIPGWQPAEVSHG